MSSNVGSNINLLKSKKILNFSCIACSENILKNFKDDRNKFLINVMNKEDYLEDISGISKLVSEINLDDMEYEGMENDF